MFNLLNFSKYLLTEDGIKRVVQNIFDYLIKMAQNIARTKIIP